MITEQDVENVQQIWGSGVVKIGSTPITKRVSILCSSTSDKNLCKRCEEQLKI